MSEQGWQEFLAAEGVEDWVVLHGGATAAFRVGSLSEATRLAEAMAGVPGVAGAGVLLTLRHAMQIDVSVAREHVQARLEAAVAAGGRIVDDSHAPSNWTLADQGGNRVCICAWPDGSASPGA